MSTSSVFSVVITLAVVLGVMGVALRLLRKYAMGGTTRHGAITMEVLQRLTLGQRQGLAVVRIGTRILAVSMGDGGVHPVAELDANELVSVAETPSDTQGIAQNVVQRIVPSIGILRMLAHPQKAVDVVEPQRISYVAPMEDFQAVLSMAMSGVARS